MRSITTLTATILLVALGSTDNVQGQQASSRRAAPPAARLSILQKPTQAHFGNQADPAKSPVELPAGTLVVNLGSDDKPRGIVDQPTIRIRPVDPRKARTGWIEKQNAVQLVAFKPVDGKKLASSDRGDLPALLQMQPDQVKVAWNEIATAIDENQKLPKPLPEPYFVRGEIWTLVGNHDQALRDYLTATQLAIDSEVELATYSSYFLRLHEALKHFDSEPKSPFEGGNPHFLALDHYSQGFSAFWRGDMPKALREFDDAIQLNPKDPIYWYYRALAHRQSGDGRRAQHDALIGAALERERLTDCDAGLSRVQGHNRSWLQGMRRGGRSALAESVSR